MGCGGMAGLDDAVRERAGVPVVDGVTAAVTVAEHITGWPLAGTQSMAGAGGNRS